MLTTTIARRSVSGNKDTKMKKTNEKFFIAYSDGVSDGYVDYEDLPTNNIDNCILFNSEEDCQKYIDTIQSEWASKLYAQKIEE